MKSKTLFPGKAWISVSNYERHLYTELALPFEKGSFSVSAPDAKVYGNIVYREIFPSKVFWKQLCLEEPFIANFESISEAAALLRDIQRNWAHYPSTNFRRPDQTAAKLPFINRKKKQFPYEVPLSPMGVWTLISDKQLLASSITSSPLPLGTLFFEEDHENPPSRAYLKLWEALTLVDYYYRAAGLADKGEGSLPHARSRCVDAGASPGGWTWVLKNLGAEITAIDRAELSPELMSHPLVTFVKHDAFTLRPEDLGEQDWVFSDVICYPLRLLQWIEKWLESGLCTQFICTIKMQGDPDFEAIRKFAAIPHSKVIHLTANKHELTWMCAPFIT